MFSLPAPWGRLVWPALMFTAGITLGLVWRDALVGWLQSPLRATLYYTDVAGNSGFSWQICLTAGLLAVAPALVYGLVGFARPAHLLSRRQSAELVGVSGALTVAGVLFAYYAALPVALHFLRAIDVQHLHPLIAADSYLRFVMNLLAVFALAFQLPLLALAADRLEPIAFADLRRLRPWVAIGAPAAALILPLAPDPVSQLMLALPVVALYEAAMWVVLLNHRRGRRLRAAPPTPAQPAQARLPMAIAVPHRPGSQTKPRMEPIRSKGPAIIDMRPKR